MAKCTVRLELDRPDGRYAMGEKVTGTVHVQVDQDCRCKKLTLRREWKTSGRGNLSSGGRVDIVLFEGEWKAGGDHEYRFEFEAPPGPVSHKGTLISVDWYLRARADIPWALDPKADRILTLLPGPVANVDLGPHYKPTGVDATKMHGGGCLLLVGAIGVAIGLALTLPTIFILIEFGEVVPSAQLLVSGIVTLIFSLLLFFGLRNRLAGRKLGDLKVELEPNVIRAGEGLLCAVSFTPRGSMIFNHVTVTLRGQETAVSGSGKHQTTHVNKFLDQKIPLSGNVEVPSGKPVRFEAILPLPANAPPTFMAGSNVIKWNVILHLDIHRWPDWKRDISFTVVP